MAKISCIARKPPATRSKRARLPIVTNGSACTSTCRRRAATEAVTSSSSCRVPRCLKCRPRIHRHGQHLSWSPVKYRWQPAFSAPTSCGNARVPQKPAEQPADRQNSQKGSVRTRRLTSCRSRYTCTENFSSSSTTCPEIPGSNRSAEIS